MIQQNSRQGVNIRYELNLQTTFRKSFHAVVG